MSEPIHARIFRGDARDLSPLRDGEVDLIVSSPPYWALKDYGRADQIGFGQSLHDYLFDLARVWNECFRVLKSGRRLCINIGDQFAKSEIYGRYKVIPLHCEVVAQCESLGFDYMGSIIWQKKTTMNPSGGGVVMGSFPHPPNGVVELDYEHILLFKKPGEAEKIEPEVKKRSALTQIEWKTYFTGHWNFGGAKQLEHEAVFPDELPRRLIKMFSFVGETVLDPFLGSGTTAKIALELGRSAIGYEINAGYIPFIRQKLAAYAARVEVLELPVPTLPPLSLSYSPHVENARIGQNTERPVHPLWKVVDIVNERTVRLESGREVGLLGVEVAAEHIELARAYLREFVRGQQVYLRFDELTGNDNEAYLMLKNKIFINRKMIEMGLATAAQGNYKWREKFAALNEPRA